MGEGGVPMFDEATREYLRAVRHAPGWVTAPWRTSDCPQCGHVVHGGGLVTYSDGEIQRTHVLIRGSVVLGCGGGWIVDPAALGLARGQWMDWRGELDCGWINRETGPDGDRYVVTLFGAYVGPLAGGAARTYAAALALLRAEYAPGFGHLQVPQGWEPDVYYHYHDTGTGTMIRFPCRLAQVCQDWDRPTRLEDELRYAGLGPHITVEAFCLLCGEKFNPGGPDDMTHGQTSEGEPCGGPGVLLAAGGAPYRLTGNRHEPPDQSLDRRAVPRVERLDLGRPRRPLDRRSRRADPVQPGRLQRPAADTAPAHAGRHPPRPARLRGPVRPRRVRLPGRLRRSRRPVLPDPGSADRQAGQPGSGRPDPVLRAAARRLVLRGGPVAERPAHPPRGEAHRRLAAPEPKRIPVMTVFRPSYNEDSAWCQEHGHTGVLAGCRLCDTLLACDPAFAHSSGLLRRHNLDGTRSHRADDAGPPLWLLRGGRVL
jgi:hypothetical protein